MLVHAIIIILRYFFRLFMLFILKGQLETGKNSERGNDTQQRAGLKPGDAAARPTASVYGASALLSELYDAPHVIINMTVSVTYDTIILM